MWLIDKLFRRKIIIAIHGLANKPPKRVLKKWWKQSIREGLGQVDRKRRRFLYDFAYWADLMHENPLDPEEKDPKSERFIDNPYRPGDPSVYEKFKPSMIKKKILDGLEKKVDRMFFEDQGFINFDRIADRLMRNLFMDLDYYYHRECSVSAFRGLKAGEEVRRRLVKVLKKHRRKKILLIAHSMGTIISYDVLTREVPEVTIDTFITIGSPLALPVVMKKILAGQGTVPKAGMKIPTPENVNRWLNFSDLDDRVAINYGLSDDYSPNSRGVSPVDTIVLNNYMKNGKKDAHNSYGYCRAPEVSRAIRDFLR